jgi:hypothetical protein
MNSLQRCTCKATIIGLCLAATSGAYAAGVGSINSAYINPNSVFQPQIPGSVFTGVSNLGNPQNGTLAVFLNEANVGNPGGGANTFANQNVWFFSADNGVSAYQFQAGDYFHASFSLTLSGGTPLKDLEAGFLFNNPSGNFGGNLQIPVVNNGVIFQGGGPSYYPFDPAAGGYGAAPFLPPSGIPNYIVGTTITEGLNYVVDPNTGMNAFQYSVNGVYALNPNLANTPYFDLGVGQFVGPGDTLGGYFQIQTSGNPNSPNNGTAVFDNITIPEPSTLAFLGLGMVTLLLRRRRI